ncbi:MAG: GGDEF domain-containing protein [Chloroflexaceae bacterium]|nr:GGDEF domain-containing protein [Chloroflexaceae bacterium]
MSYAVDHTEPHIHAADRPLFMWRQKALTMLLRIVLIFALPVVALDIFTMIETRQPMPTLFYVGAYLWVAVITFVSRIPYILRVGTLIGIMFLVGSIEASLYGLRPPSLLFMQASIILSILFFDVAGLIVVGTWVAAMIAFSFFFVKQAYQSILVTIDIAILILLTAMSSALILNLMKTMLHSLHRAEHLAVEAQHALHQAFHDALTGLYNRRYLDDQLSQLLARTQADSTPVSLLLLDIDYFKQFNDTYGHAAGDAVLRAVGVILASNTTETDIAARWGGEEFVVVLPGLGVERAVERAEQLRVAVQQLALMYSGQQLGMITVSIGVATFPTHGNTVTEGLYAADSALYAAKRNGRDQIVVAGTGGARPVRTTSVVRAESVAH